MSTRSKAKPPPKKVVVQMQKLGDEFFEEDDEQPIETIIGASCTENIYNAFLLLKYRSEPDIQRARERSPIVANSVGIIAYLIAIFQWIALIMLITVTALGYGNAEVSDLRKWEGAGDRPWTTFFLWPFFMFAVLLTFREGKKSDLDIRILKEMGITRWNPRDCRCLPHVFLLKIVTEQYFAYLGSLVYLFVLVIYTQNFAEWSQYDNLVVILNLLAYEMILDADEYVYEVFKPFIVEYMVQNAIQTPLFDGKYKKLGEYGITDKSKIFMWMTAAILYTSVIQAVYSRRYVFMIAIVIAWMVALLPLWGCYVTVEIAKQRKYNSQKSGR